MSRFIGKIALEALAYRGYEIESWLEKFVDDIELDPLRNYVRRGSNNLVWPFHQRVIYEENGRFEDEEYGKYQVLHEFTFQVTAEEELFFVLVIFGVEYALNLEDPDVSGYIKWEENNNKSPLYP